MTSDPERPSLGLLATCVSSPEACLCKPSPDFELVYFLWWVRSCKRPLCILDPRSFLVRCVICKSAGPPPGGRGSEGQACLISTAPPGPGSCLSGIPSLRASLPATWEVMQGAWKGPPEEGRGQRVAVSEAQGHGAQGERGSHLFAGTQSSRGAGWSQEHPPKPLGRLCWGGWACRGWVFWKPAIVARHVRRLPGAKGPRALAVTSVWDGSAYCVPLGICLVPRPDL